MKARSHAVIEAGGVLREVSSQPPLTLRRLWAADRSTCALGLVGSAAGPMADDDFELSIEVKAGARATLTPAGASIALGRRAGEDAPSHTAAVSTHLTLAAGSRLSGRTGAMVVSSGGAVDIGLRVRLSGDAHLTWIEVLALGRSNEVGGAVRIGWDVERDGWPLLRQVTDLRDPARQTWPGAVAGRRVLASALRVGPDVKARTVAVSRTAAVHALAEDAELITVLADDAADATRELESLLSG